MKVIHLEQQTKAIESFDLPNGWSIKNYWRDGYGWLITTPDGVGLQDGFSKEGAEKFAAAMNAPCYAPVRSEKVTVRDNHLELAAQAKSIFESGETSGMKHMQVAALFAQLEQAGGQAVQPVQSAVECALLVLGNCVDWDQESGLPGEYDEDKAAALIQSFADAQPADAVREAGLGMRRIVEELTGAINHGEWRDSNGKRLKDTPEWVVFYNALAASQPKGCENA